MAIPPVDEQLWTAQVGQTLYTVTYEGAQAVRFNFEADASTISLPVLILWTTPGGLNCSGLDQARRDILGYPLVLVGNDNENYLARRVPMPALPFLQLNGLQPYLYAMKFTGTGYGVPTDVVANGTHDPVFDWPRFRYAKGEVEFQSLTYDILTDADMVTLGLVDEFGNPDESTLARYVTIQANPGMEYLVLALGGVTSGFRYVGPLVGGNPAPVPGGPGKLTPNYDLSLTWHQVPKSCVGTNLFNPTLLNPPIDLCLGCVNADPFPSFPETGPFAVPESLMTAYPVSGGTGYKAGDIVELTFVLAGTAPTLRVTSVGAGGSVLTVERVNPGSVPNAAVNFPTNPVNVFAVTGVGLGLTLNCTSGAGLPPGTLLLCGAQIRPVRSTAGDRLYDIEYRFKYLPQGVQSLYYQGTSANNFADAGFFEVTTNGLTNTGLNKFNNDPSQPPVNIYPWQSMDQLWQVPS